MVTNLLGITIESFSRSNSINWLIGYLKKEICIYCTITEMSSPDSSVGIATAYGLGGQGSIPGKGKSFFLLHNVRTGSEAHPASYPMGTGGSLRRGKAAGA
jgi:hypothetical protein